MNFCQKWAVLSTAICLLSNQHGMFADTEQTMKEPGLLLPPKQGEQKYFFTAGFLVEQIRMTGTQYAYTKNGNAIGSTSIPASGSVLVPKFDMSWGVTTDFAYFFPQKDWTLNLRFDWLTAVGRGRSTAERGENVIPVNIWRDQFFAVESGDLGVAGFGKSRFNVNYYNMNADLLRSVYIDKNFTIEPHIGLKLAFIYDNVELKFTGNGSDTAFAPDLDLNTNKLMRHQHTDFWGVGPSMGLNTDWNIQCGVSLFFEGTAAILMGYSHTSDKVDFAALAGSHTRSSSRHIPVFSPTLQTLLGFKYEKNFYHDAQKVRVRLGWDTSFFWNQWNHINTVSEATFNSSLDTFQLKEGDTFGLTGILFDITWGF